MLPEELGAALTLPPASASAAGRTRRSAIASAAPQQADDSLLRQSRLLPEEPPVLQCRRGLRVLLASRQVQGPYTLRGHRRRAGNAADLLSSSTRGQYESRPQRLPGQVALNSPGFRTPPSGISPFCCSRPVRLVDRAQGKVCVDLQSDSQNCGSCGNVCQSGTCSQGSWRLAVIASTLPIRRNLPPRLSAL